VPDSDDEADGVGDPVPLVCASFDDVSVDDDNTNGFHCGGAEIPNDVLVLIELRPYMPPGDTTKASTVFTPPSLSVRTDERSMLISTEELIDILMVTLYYSTRRRCCLRVSKL